MKHCPVCRTTQLSKMLLEANLPTFACPYCEGEWIAQEACGYFLTAPI